mgnify:CR=1 FL=1
MIYSIDGILQPAVGKRAHWEHFRTFEKDQPDTLVALQESAQHYLGGRADYWASNFWAKQVLESGDYPNLAAGLLGMVFWNYVALLEEKFVFHDKGTESGASVKWFFPKTD